jgi:hypothetical protein
MTADQFLGLALFFVVMSAGIGAGVARLFGFHRNPSDDLADQLANRHETRVP